MQISNLEAYLTQTAKYAVIKVYRSRASSETHLTRYAQTIETTHAETEDIILLNSLNQGWLAALNALPDKTRAVFQFSRMDHLSNKEIADKVGLTEKAVEYHITKALKLLKLMLRDFFLFLVCFSL